MNVVGMLATEVMEKAVLNAIMNAKSSHGIIAKCDFKKSSMNSFFLILIYMFNLYFFSYASTSMLC